MMQSLLWYHVFDERHGSSCGDNMLCVLLYMLFSQGKYIGELQGFAREIIALDGGP